MVTSYQWLSTGTGVLVAAVIFYLVRRDHLHGRYALWWLPIAVVVAVLGAYPRLVDLVGPVLGIHYPPVLPLVVGFALVLIKLLMMDIERSKNERRLQRLIQRVAILEGRLRHTPPVEPEEY